MRFYGIYDTIPSKTREDYYVLQRDYGFLRDDGLMVIAPKGVEVNGANIPKMVWVFMGSPLEGNNKYWSVHHDVLYSKHAIILDCNSLHIAPKQAFQCWEELHGCHFIHQAHMNKLFADNTMLQAMKTLGVGRTKRFLAYHAVRVGGRGWWGRA